MTHMEADTQSQHLTERPELSSYLEHRPDLLRMIREAEVAALTPQDPGGLDLDLRAALAGRIARLNGEDKLAEAYLAYLAKDAEKAIADPKAHSDLDRMTGGILTFADKVAVRPRDVVASDIDALRDAGVSEPDIVRLAELVAFVSFQVRVLQGAALMEAQA